jgi:hypothetical protein
MVPPLISVEVIEEVVAAAGSLLLPVLGKFLGVENLLNELAAKLKKKEPPSPTSELISRLNTASTEMDAVIKELQAAADERSNRVTALEKSIQDLINKESDLKERVEGTEGISKATVAALANIVEAKIAQVEGPKRRRDYALFAAGVIVSAIVGIGIEATKPVWEGAFHIQGASLTEPAPKPPANIVGNPSSNISPQTKNK